MLSNTVSEKWVSAIPINLWAKTKLLKWKDGMVVQVFLDFNMNASLKDFAYYLFFFTIRILLNKTLQLLTLFTILIQLLYTIDDTRASHKFLGNFLGNFSCFEQLFCFEQVLFCIPSNF